METRDIVCYLPIEIKSRELDAKIYLALRLIEKGFFGCNWKKKWS